MGNGKLTEHAQNLQGCEKCNLRKAVGNLEMPYGCEITVIAQEGLKKYYTSILVYYTSILSELAIPHIRCCLSAIPSDLMKSTVVDESLSSMNQQFCFQRKSTFTIIIIIIIIII